MVGQHSQIDAHAHGKEKQPEQQALEWLDTVLDGMAIFGFGQHQPGQEGTQRHRQAGGAGDQRCAKHGEQDHRHEQFRQLGGAGAMEQRPQQETPGQRDQRQGAGRLGQGEQDQPG